METERIKALITLLDDPSREVFNTVEGELLKAEVGIVTQLEEAWELQSDEVLQQRIEDIIHSLQFRDVKKRFRSWVVFNGEDLLTGAWLVARYQYPELTFEEVDRSIEKIRKDIWLELNEHLTALEKVRIINHILFDVYGFSRNNNNYLAPQNSFICDVLDTRKGNPITLSIIYAVIAGRLGLPVYGVNLPQNFILAFMDEPLIRSYQDKNQEASVLFYINPINKGTVLGRKEIEYFIKQQKLEPHYSYFEPCSNIEIVRRIFTHLTHAYEHTGQYQKSKEINEIKAVFDEDALF
jgi:regulator of sirC expression with transglutaminase-like and TPR domain